MTAPVCCACLLVLAVCTCICASNVSLYRRTHVHPYLPGHTHQLVFIRMYTSVYNTHNQYLCTWTVTHIYTVAGESYANTMGGEAQGTSSLPPPLLYLCQPFEMYQGILWILLPRSLRFVFMLNSLNFIFVSHAASKVKSAVSVNSMGYSTEHTSVPQFITKLLISSFIYV